GRFARADMCFQIENARLCVFLRPVGDPLPPGRSVTGVSTLPGVDGEAPLRVVKRLPQEPPVADADLAWLLEDPEPRPGRLFDEVIKQNQEVLALLTELYACRAHLARDGTPPGSPSAA